MATTVTTSFKFYLLAIVITPCTISDTYYIIEPSSYNMDVNFADFAYAFDPSSSVSSSYTFTYSITAALASGNTSVVPLWADILSSSNIITISTIATADAGVYSVMLKGTLSDSLGTSSNTSF